MDKDAHQLALSSIVEASIVLCQLCGQDTADSAFDHDTHGPNLCADASRADRIYQVNRMLHAEFGLCLQRAPIVSTRARLGSSMMG